MSLIDSLSQPECWEKFYKYKFGLACPKTFLKELRSFIDNKDYIPVCEMIRSGNRFPLPEKSVISKMSSQKKRIVFTYPKAENTVLKLLTYLLLRKYDHCFAPNLYSFRPGRTAKDALKKLIAAPHIDRLYSYKVDISDYFNSVPVDILLPRLEEITSDDPVLFSFLSSLLNEKEIIFKGQTVIEKKGIMAGTPLSAFYANLFLSELDRYFYDLRVPYARYSDDIIIFAESHEKTEQYADTVRNFLNVRGLKVNPEKESYSSPENGWIFLGFSYKNSVVDIAPASIKKLKQKMHRKTRALQRWQKRNCLGGEKAALAFIRIFNRKLFDNSSDNDLTWSLWYFPVINTTDSLIELDHYAQDCIRFLISGTRTKARFNIRYSDIKQLGYRSLVHEYYKFHENNL